MQTKISKKSPSRSARAPSFAHFGKLNGLEKFAVWITGYVGSMEFFLFIVAATALWLLWNIFAPAEFRFDPFPAFVLWLFISNLLQLFLLPLIMVSQNLQNKGDQARAEADLRVNLDAEREVKEILAILQKQQKLLEDLIERRKAATHD